MNPGFAHFLRLMALGPLICLCSFGLASLAVVALALGGRLRESVSALHIASAEMESAPFYSFLRGAASVALALFFAVVVCFRIKPFNLLGAALLLLTYVCAVGGYAVTAVFVGRRLSGAVGTISTDGIALRSGFLVVTSATIVPILGWIIAGAAVLAGTGAFIKTALSRATPPR